MRWLLVLFLFPVAAGQPILSAVVPDLPGPGPGDEAFAVWSPVPVDLTGWSVTDGEGSWSFPAGMLVGPSETWFVGDPVAWASFGMPLPDAVWEGPLLANDGDELVLVEAGGGVRDAFAWGDGGHAEVVGSVAYTSPGLVYRRLGGDVPVDTDSADDWRTPRVHRVGESGLDQPAWMVPKVTVYASPDSSFQVLSELLAGARERVVLHVYALRSADVVDGLVAAAVRGAEVHVLVTRQPVGMTREERHETAHALQRVVDAGGMAWLADRGRYVFHHLKVLVVDDAVAVQSENWVPSGVPVDPSWGNRGWGIVLHHGPAADWFAAWMADDRAAWDVVPFVLASFDPGYREPVRMPPRAGVHVPVSPATFEGPFRVTPIVAPDHTADPALDPVAQLAAGARERLLVQQMDLSLWGLNRLGWSGEDAMASALEEAVHHGADVTVMAAAPFGEDRDAVEALGILERRTGLRGVVEDVPGIATMHNKGLVADDAVVVGSMNANHHSRSENREVSVMVEGAVVADWYAVLFEADTRGHTPWDAVEAPSAPLPTLMALLLLVGSCLRCCRSTPCWSSP